MNNRHFTFGLCFAILIIIIFNDPALLGQQRGTRNLSSLNPPYLLQFNLNYDQSLPDLLAWNKESARSEYIYTGKTFGADKGFGLSAISAIQLGGNIYFTQSIEYNRILSYDYLKNESTFDKGFADYHAYTFGIGFEYYFALNRNFRIFVGGEINASMINGESDTWLQRPGNPLADTMLSFSILNSFRSGFGLNFGTEYMLNNKLGLSLGVKLMNLNSFIKKAEDNHNEAEFELRDDDHPDLIFAGKKEFVFYSASAGIIIHFGLNPKKKKL